MFVGIFIIAVLQGLLMGVLYWMGKVPYLPLWTLLSLVAAMLPLGASLVAIPIGILQLVAGNYTSAIIVLGGYLLLVSNIDNLVRPKLVSKEAYMNFALLMLSALGGYELFGFFGVIYGPVLMILFLTTVDVYLAYYAESNSPAEDSEPQSALPAQEISDTVEAAPPLPLDDGTVGATAPASD
jgi:predicted PurR-regulated permease PerM